MLPVILHQYIIALRISKGNQNFSKKSAVRIWIPGKINRLFPRPALFCPAHAAVILPDYKNLLFVVTLRLGLVAKVLSHPTPQNVRRGLCPLLPFRSAPVLGNH